MAEAWDGDEGDHWARNADMYERGSARHWKRFLEGNFVATDDRVLDIGCGTGRSTRDAARVASSGSVLGVDLSARMLGRARAQTAIDGIVNVRFEQADAQVHPFERSAFDVTISSFGVMFFGDPIAAFANIGSALRPGGQLALLTWQELGRNEWITALREALAVGRTLPEPPHGAPSPFALAEPDRVRAVLGDAGFDAIELDGIEEPLDLGPNVDDAYGFLSTMGVVRGLTQDLDSDLRALALDRLRDVLDTHNTDEGVLVGSSAWLITARRVGN
ncbi:MAG: class I SAM-dependent methyltransferase [Acidimicrobiales bacterium]